MIKVDLDCNNGEIMINLLNIPLGIIDELVGTMLPSCKTIYSVKDLNKYRLNFKPIVKAYIQTSTVTKSYFINNWNSLLQKQINLIYYRAAFT